MPRMTVRVRGLDSVTKYLEKKQRQAEAVITNTASDMRTRVPTWVTKEVMTDYNIKKTEVKPKGKKSKGPKLGTVQVSGVTIESVAIVYEGNPLTPTHFAMKPTRRKKASKRKRKHRKRTTPRPQATPITAEIKKGQRKELPSDAFLGKNKGGGYIPFRRTGPSRYPIESIKTVSLPQMVTNENVSQRINQKINQELPKRLEHNLKRYLEKK